MPALATIKKVYKSRQDYPEKSVAPIFPVGEEAANRGPIQGLLGSQNSRKKKSKRFWPKIGL